MSQMTIPLVAGIFSTTCAALITSTVCAQTYPAKPVRIVTSEAGGGNDLTARIIAPGLTERLGQQVIVDNRSALPAIDAVTKAPPDGHTLLLTGTILWVGPLLLNNITHDALRDFAPVAIVVNSPSIVTTHPSLPVKSIMELVTMAKSRPGELNYASGANGAPPHLAGELFKAMAGVNIVVIPYRGSGPAINALIGGQVQLMFPTPGSVAQHVKSGRLRAIAVTSAQPSALLPGLPTVAASGVPGYEADAMQPIYAPANTPAAIINRLHQEIAQVLNRSDVKEKFLNTGVETVGGSPEQLLAKMKVEIAKWGKLIKSAGLHE